MLLFPTLPLATFLCESTKVNIRKRTAKHNFVSVHDARLQCLNSRCLKPSAVLPLSSWRGGYGTSGRTMKTLFFLSSAKVTRDQKSRWNYSLTPRDGYCKVHVSSEENNFYSISTFLCTFQGQHSLTHNNLALSSFSRKYNSVWNLSIWKSKQQSCQKPLKDRSEKEV